VTKRFLCFPDNYGEWKQKVTDYDEIIFDLECDISKDKLSASEVSIRSDARPVLCADTA
jgi:hypothetical protein